MSPVDPDTSMFGAHSIVPLSSVSLGRGNPFSDSEEGMVREESEGSDRRRGELLSGPRVTSSSYPTSGNSVNPPDSRAILCPVSSDPRRLGPTLTPDIPDPCREAPVGLRGDPTCVGPRATSSGPTVISATLEEDGTRRGQGDVRRPRSDDRVRVVT